MAAGIICKGELDHAVCDGIGPGTCSAASNLGEWARAECQVLCGFCEAATIATPSSANGSSSSSSGGGEATTIPAADDTCTKLKGKTCRNTDGCAFDEDTKRCSAAASTTSGTGRIVDLRAGTVDSNLLTVLRSCSKHGLEAGLLDILEGGAWTDDDVHAWHRYLKLRRNGWSTITPKRQLYNLFKRYRTLSSSPDDIHPVTNQETKKPRSK